MSRSPYSAYHGRKRPFRSVLIGVAAALVVLLAAVLAGYYFGFFNIPGQPGGTPGTPTGTPVSSDVPTQSVEPGQSAAPTGDPIIVIEGPSAPPSAKLPEVEADLSKQVIRDIPLGLVQAKADALPETSRHGVLVDMTDADLAEVDADLAETLAGYPYAAAWLDADWKKVEADDLAARCAALAALGFDELIFSAADPAKGGDAALADLYAAVRDALDKAGWKGRLGLDLDQDWFKVDSAVLVPTIADKFDRLYFRKTLSTGNKNTLTNGGFVANGRTIVTVVKTPPT